MPRFLLPIFILGLISLAGFGYVVLKLDPEQTSSVAFFLLTFFSSLVSVLSVLFFFAYKKFFFKPKTFTALGPVIITEDLRPLFRTSFRNAILVVVVIIALLVFRRLV